MLRKKRATLLFTKRLKQVLCAQLRVFLWVLTVTGCSCWNALPEIDPRVCFRGSQKKHGNSQFVVISLFFIAQCRMRHTKKSCHLIKKRCVLQNEIVPMLQVSKNTAVVDCCRRLKSSKTSFVLLQLELMEWKICRRWDFEYSSGVS